MNEVMEKAMKDQDELSHQIKSDASRSLAMGRRDVLRQGDIYILKLPTIPAKATPRTNRQLADGNTQGSRHVLKGKVELYDAEPGDVLAMVREEYPEVDLRDYQIGPVFRTAGGSVVEHPEHGNRELSEPGCYGVVFQRSLDADGREERARD